MNGTDIIKIACIQGLIKQVQAKIKDLSDTDAVKTNMKAVVAQTLSIWERDELFELQKVYEEVKTG